MRADKMASHQLPEAVRLAWDDQAWCAAHGGKWWDDLGIRLEAVKVSDDNSKCEVSAHIQKRRAQDEHCATPPGNPSNKVRWDSRIWTRSKEKDWTLLPFRLRLWWRHLLPHNVRHAPCSHCGQAVDDLQFHILGECTQ